MLGVCRAESGCGEVVRKQSGRFLTQPSQAAPPPCSALPALAGEKWLHGSGVQVNLGFQADGG